ncbi:hypothetical protein SNE40_012765 [Patella caerulea]|uniref:Uncharacterized protein n=1 Tax=Patella caerulea TaxID=87958 RepID=A0AAN8JKV3_PATCE
MERSEILQGKLSQNEQYFHRAYEQIVLLDNKLKDLQVRYNRAKRDGNRSFCYTIRLKMSGVQGVRNVYRQYIQHKADTIVELRHDISIAEDLADIIH